MDVIAVRNRAGQFFSTDFYVKLKVPIYGVEQASAIFLGLSEDGDLINDSLRRWSAEEIIDNAEREVQITIPTEGEEENSSPRLSDESRNVGSSTKSINSSALRERLEPFIVDITNNHCRCSHPNLIAYVGERQQLRFYDLATRHHYSTPPSRLLDYFNLIIGKNVVTCTHRASKVQASFPIWAYESDARLIIMDIDGTITKSDVTGYITTVYFGIYSYVHYGLVEWLNRLQELFNYQCLYLTARPYSHRKQTRLLLNMIRGQVNPEYELPEGPLLTTADTAMTALYHEFVARDQARSKSDVLCSIWDVFKLAGCTALSPFKLGVGNKEHDAMAYNSVGVPGDAVFVVNKDSKIVVWKYSIPSYSRMTSHNSASNRDSGSSSTAAGTEAEVVEQSAQNNPFVEETVVNPYSGESADVTTAATSVPSKPLPIAINSTSSILRPPALLRSRSEKLPASPPIHLEHIPKSEPQSPISPISRDDIHFHYHPRGRHGHDDNNLEPATERSQHRRYHPELGHINPADNAVTLALQSASGVHTFQTYADPLLLQYICELELRRSQNDDFA
jgi:hypothetical protein